MPELPEVETTVRGLRPLVGSAFTALDVYVPQLRFSIPTNLAQYTVDSLIVAVRRRAKYGMVDFENGYTLLFHLGMSGRMVLAEAGTPRAKHDHLVWHLPIGSTLRLHDPRRFGLVDIALTESMAQHRLLSRLGPEPLTDAFTPKILYAASRGRQQAIKTLLMDSHVVVGVGNIYANEALFKAGIRPHKAAGKLTKAQCVTLVAEVKGVLAAAIAAGGSSLRDYAQADGKLGYFYEQFTVYGRAGQPCIVCKQPLKKDVIGQRATVFCNSCQT